MKKSILLITIFSLSVALSAQANTENDVNNGSIDLTNGASYSGGAPTTTSDVTFLNATYSPAAFTIGSSISIGTLNDLSPTALTIANPTGTATLTLNGGSNSVAPSNGGAAGDLIFVGNNGSLSITTATNKVLGIALAAGGNFDVGSNVGGTLDTSSAINENSFGINKTGAAR